MDKIFETNFKFHLKWKTTVKIKYLFFSDFVLVLTKYLFWEKVWALKYNPGNF